ncbi:MAG: SRPBCC family protein [Fulvivirga sp.]|nr:SRPBCC family protein [Fulvivirga sp.]
MNDRGKLIDKHTLRFERLLPGPIERVWEYVTDAEKRGLWFASGKMELKPGGDITFIFNNNDLSETPDSPPEKYKEYDGEVRSTAQVINCDPPQKITFSWGDDGIVTIELKEQADKVLLVLTHEKLSKNKDARLGIMAGWHTHLNILRDKLEGKTINGFWKQHTACEKEYFDES